MHTDMSRNEKAVALANGTIAPSSSITYTLLYEDFVNTNSMTLQLSYGKQLENKYAAATHQKGESKQPPINGIRAVRSIACGENWTLEPRQTHKQSEKKRHLYV